MKITTLYPFSSISVISGRKEGVNERLGAMEPFNDLKDFLPPAVVEPGTATLISQRLTY